MAAMGSRASPRPPRMTTSASSMDASSLSDSSPLSSPCSVTTPTELRTPPLSQSSTNSSDNSANASSAEEDDSRPAKRQRISSNMPRETKRLDLDECNVPEQRAELDRLLKVLRKNRKIVVVAGAGISVSAGVPDFRSSAGLFNAVKAQHNLKGSGKQLFDAAVYRDSSSTSSFHQMVRSLSTLTKSAEPTLFHHLLARLAQEGRLLRLYSQNVDGIDASMEPLATKVPLPRKGPWPKTIQLHGGLEKMICSKCHYLSDFNAEIFDGPDPPECEQCKEADYARTEVAGKRSHGIGRLRPRMVLYNEHNPDDEAIGAVTKADLRRRPDAIIVVGTTLKIPGVKRIVREMCSIVRNHRDGLAVWINNDPEPSAKEFENSWDLIVRGTCDQVAELAQMKKWDDIDAEESKIVTEEESRIAKEGTPFSVVISSQSTQAEAMKVLPTPAHTPRPERSILDATVQSEVKTTNSGLRIKLNKPETPTSHTASSRPKKKAADKGAKAASMKKSRKTRNPEAKKPGPKSGRKNSMQEKREANPINKIFNLTKKGVAGHHPKDSKSKRYVGPASQIAVHSAEPSIPKPDLARASVAAGHENSNSGPLEALAEEGAHSSHTPRKTGELLNTDSAPGSPPLWKKSPTTPIAKAHMKPEPSPVTDARPREPLATSTCTENLGSTRRSLFTNT